ncbi:GLPGLI family protein [Mucilaginibacter sp.]|uniref:GLPGLI family protein n=1 Tax=Mucilaginibacter sp. TaxID=1882438 RepID=UPI003B005AC8
MNGRIYISKVCITILSICLLSTFLASAQSPEPVIAKAYYKFSHQYDTTNTNLIKTENYILLLGKTSSVYKSYDRAKQDSEMLANLKLTGAMAPPAGKRADGEELFYYFIPKKTFLRVRILGDYAVEKPFNDLNWKIDKETKKIANLDCQKATATYNGRDYIAWFTSSLPFQAGPWKLHGLPGLIITAYDKTGRIRFDFNGFEQVKVPNEEIAWSKKYIPISIEDYKKMAKSYENDPKSFLENQFGGKLTTSMPLRHINILAQSSMVNFPMEIVPDSIAKK